MKLSVSKIFRERLPLRQTSMDFGGGHQLGDDGAGADCRDAHAVDSTRPAVTVSAAPILYQ